MRVLGYARVSSVAQADGTSLQDQQNAQRAYASTRGLNVDRFYVEAESAVYERIERRAEMRALLADARRGDLVLCDKVDRWSRDPEFTYRTVRELLAAKVAVYFVTDQCDPSTDAGDSNLNLRVLMAKEEHKRIKQRLVGTRRILRDQGYYVEGLPPIGYVRPRTPDRLGHNVLAPDAAIAPVVAEIFRRCAREPISDLLAWLEAEHGGRRWDKKSLGGLLRSRIYLGEALDSRGLWIKGKHTAIVDAGTWARAQVALDARRLGGARVSGESHTKNWLLREIGQCARCEAKISAAYGGPTTSYRYYYRCPRGCAGYARVDEQDAAAAAAVEGRLVELRALLARPAAPPRPPVDNGPKLAALDRKRARALEAFTDELMTRDELRAVLAKIDADRARLDVPVPAPARRPRDVLAQLGEIRRAWPHVDAEGRREILRRLARRVRIAKGVDPQIDWRPVEDVG